MNIYAPSNASSDHPLPVFFFIQGGGFNGNSNPNYNGSGLIEASNHNIIVVNFNYRVGPYGFLASEEVVKGGSINNGLKDQIKALQWMQKHISKFGGDPNHVVLGGASAGAASITLLLTAHNGRNDNLFHATAAESQSFAAVRSISESQFEYDNLVIRTGCVNANDTLACLRGLNATYLQSQNKNTPFPGAQNPPLYMYGPTLDGDVVPDLTLRAYHKGNFIKLPAIYGDDTNEGTVFVPQNTSTIGESNTFIKDQFPAITTKQLRRINQLYPKAEQFNNSGAYWRQASNAYGDIRYVCPGIDVSDVYAGMFNRTDIWNCMYSFLPLPRPQLTKRNNKTTGTSSTLPPQKPAVVSPTLSKSTPSSAPRTCVVMRLPRTALSTLPSCQLPRRIGRASSAASTRTHIGCRVALCGRAGRVNGNKGCISLLMRRRWRRWMRARGKGVPI